MAKDEKAEENDAAEDINKAPEDVCPCLLDVTQTVDIKTSEVDVSS